jgi:transcriptional regulator with XRE-family HTH domain
VSSQDGGSRTQVGAMGLGSKIRKRRREQGLTISELSSRTDLAVSMLSQVERDVVTPSISSLRRIASALQVPAFYFLIEEHDMDRMVVRASDRRTLRLPGYHATYYLLTPSLDTRIEMISLELGPGEASAESPMAHEGEECLTLVQGRLKVVMPTHETILEAGDSAFFQPMLPHQVINIGDKPAIAICAITPPSF